MTILKGSVVFECDGCGTTGVQSSKSEEKPIGFHGMVQETHRGGVSDTDTFYACSPDCILGAVIYATTPKEDRHTMTKTKPKGKGEPT